MRKRSEHQTDYWQSYSDMMAALLLIFMLFIGVVFVQLEEQKDEVEELEKTLIGQQEALTQKEEELETQKELLKAQGDEYMVLKELLEAKQEQLDKIVGIKAEIIQALQEEFSENKLEITIDAKTGAIRFQSEILFATDKSELTNAGKNYLKKIIPLYFEILLSDTYSEYVSEIIIEGNCDSTGSYDHNLILSQDRARSVATYCIDVMDGKFSNKKMEELLAIMNISGRSNKNVIYDENNQEDLKASRRVEVKFRLKDEQMIEEMLKILEEE